jgi:hypothetical protein
MNLLQFSFSRFKICDYMLNSTFPNTVKGAEKSLPKIQVILAEVNLLDIHQNVPLLAEMIAWLDKRNWVAYDICGLTRRPLDKALWQADLIFVPRHSPLRADKRWSA